MCARACAGECGVCMCVYLGVRKCVCLVGGCACVGMSGYENACLMCACTSFCGLSCVPTYSESEYVQHIM